MKSTLMKYNYTIVVVGAIVLSLSAVAKADKASPLDNNQTLAHQESLWSPSSLHRLQLECFLPPHPENPEGCGLFYSWYTSGGVCGNTFWNSFNDGDCNGVGGAIGTHTYQSGVAGTSQFLIVQTDGNVVLYDGSYSSPKWATNTYYGNSSILAVQDDGNMVVYYYTGSVWVPVWSLWS
jgi:hypothetical protein